MRSLLESNWSEAFGKTGEEVNNALTYATRRAVSLRLLK